MNDFMAGATMGAAGRASDSEDLGDAWPIQAIGQAAGRLNRPDGGPAMALLDGLRPAAGLLTTEMLINGHPHGQLIVLDRPDAPAYPCLDELMNEAHVGIPCPPTLGRDPGVVKRSPRVCPCTTPDIIVLVLCLVLIGLVGLVRFLRAGWLPDFDLFNRGYLQPTKAC